MAGPFSRRHSARCRFRFLTPRLLPFLVSLRCPALPSLTPASALLAEPLRQMSWDLWRCGAVRNMSTPAMTLSYRQVPTLMLIDMYPWFWWSPLMFDNHKSWSAIRYVGRLMVPKKREGADTYRTHHVVAHGVSFCTLE